MARLIYMDPEGRQQTLELNAQSPQIVIGRHPDCDLVSDDTSVSRRHCIISYEGGHYRVADLGSANGTQVNDARVTRKNLTSRDMVRCGNLLLQFFDDPEVLGAQVMPGAPPIARVPSPPVPAPARGGFSTEGLVDTSAGTSLVALMRAEIARLQGRIQHLESANAGQAERLGALQGELATAGDRIDAAFGQAAEAETESRELREQLWQNEEALRRSAAALAEREAEIERLRVAASGPVPVEVVLEAESPSAGALEALAAARAEVSRLEGALVAADAAVEAVRAPLVAEISSLRAERVALDGTHAARMAEQRSALTAAEAARDAAAAEVANLTAALEHADAARREVEATGRAAVADLERERSLLQTQRADAEEARAALALELATAKAAVERMRGERLTATSARTAEVAGLRARVSAAETEIGEVRAALAAARADAEEARAVAAAARMRHTEDPPASGPGPGLAALEQARARIAALEVTLQAAEERHVEREAHLSVLEGGRARAERALAEREAALEAVRTEVAGWTERWTESERAAEDARRDEARLRSALNEAREEAKAAGQVRRALRDAQAEIKRLAEEGAAHHAAAVAPAAPDERDRALEAARERLAAMEMRIRQTEAALAEAEGRAQEAQTALLQVREAERAARGGAAPDRATADRLNQMTVKLAAVTRRAQLAEEQAEAARRLEERTRALEDEMATLRVQLDEAEGERDHAASTTLVLLAEKRATSDEVERLRARLAELDAELTAARAGRPDWPAWMDDHFETLGELVRQFRADITEVAELWSGLPNDQLPGEGRARFSTAVASARAGADSLVEGTDAAREAIEALRAALLLEPRADH
jgi:chromosome segregation ATPase